MDAVPTPHFPASPEALTAVLVQGCHRPPGTLTGLFHSQIEPHETPHQYYQRIFIFSLRFPSLTTLGVPPPDVLAIEEAVRHTLLRCSLPQALDFLHTQLLAGICVANPVRDSPNTHPSPPLACYLTFFLHEFYRRLPSLPSFVVGLLAVSLPTWQLSVSSVTPLPGHAPWPRVTSTAVTILGSPQATFYNLHSLVQRTSKMKTPGGKGRISTETPQTKQKDAGATQITLLTGILLPLLLRSTYRPDHAYARQGRVFSQLSLPLFPRNDAQLAEAITLPVLDMEHSFYMLISALPVSSPVLSKSLSIDSLTPWAGPASILNFRPSPALQKKRLTSLHFPVSYTFFRTSSLPPSSLLSSTTFMMITSAMTLHALITCNPTIFSPGPPLTL